MTAGLQPETLLLLGGVPLGFGLILLKQGLWPRRHGDVPHCRKCDYRLTGIHSSRCPECGSALTPNTITHGERKKLPILVLAGVLGLVIAILWFVRQARVVDWYQNAPTFLLTKLILTSDPILSKRISSEMRRREERLSPSQRSRLIELALIQQRATSPAPAQSYLLEFVARACAKNQLSDAQRDQFFRQMATIELRIPPEVQRGGELRYQIKYDLRGPSRYSPEWMQIQLKHGEVQIDGEVIFPDKGWSTRWNDSLMQGTNDGGRWIVPTLPTTAQVRGGVQRHRKAVRNVAYRFLAGNTLETAFCN